MRTTRKCVGGDLVFNTDTAKNGLPQPKPGPAPLGATAQPARPSTSPFEKSTASTSGTSVIGTDLTILGDRITIISANKLQVDGDVRGNVHGKQVVITEEGSVVGMVCAEAIEVRGGVRGSIRAVTVKLQAGAQVEGDITHQKLMIAEGAEFDGRVKLTKDASELMPVLDPETIERARVNGDSRFEAPSQLGDRGD
ncbi:MAG TPA: polymer-forming cytoskeletal protein [Methyloceanibacter sp.]